MAASSPSLQISGLSALGFVLQPTFGTPVVVPANALNWVPQTSNSVKYATGQHLTKVGAGSRGLSRYGARGQSMSSGDFETYLFTSQSAALISYFFGGTDTKTGTGPYAHSLAIATNPKLLTLHDQWTTRGYQAQDVMLNTMEISSSKTDFKVKYGIMGGVADTAVTSVVATYDTTDTVPLQFGDLSAATLFGSVADAALESCTLTYTNGVKQFWGGGSYAPSKSGGGDFEIKGKMRHTFDSDAAATAYESMAVGTEANLVFTIGPVTVNAVAGCQHVITQNNARITAASKVYSLPEFVMVDTEWEVRLPMSSTYVITNNYSSAYI